MHKCQVSHKLINPTLAYIYIFYFLLYHVTHFTWLTVAEFAAKSKRLTRKLFSIEVAQHFNVHLKPLRRYMLSKMADVNGLKENICFLIWNWKETKKINKKTYRLSTSWTNLVNQRIFFDMIILYLLLKSSLLTQNLAGRLKKLYTLHTLYKILNPHPHTNLLFFSASLVYTLQILYCTHGTPCTIHITYLVQYTCDTCKIHTVHLV